MGARDHPVNGNGALVAAVLGSSMIFIDGTAVNVALPVLQRELGASAAAVGWVVEGYALFLSALILIGGSLGDLFGRRRIFALGIAIFTLASIGCAAAPNVALLVLARCVQGVGGALATPGSLALISAAFTGVARGRAIGTWSAFSVIVSAIGPVAGGWLVQAFSWRAIFFVNVPIAALTLVILRSSVAESRDESASSQVDYAGALFATAGLAALVFGLLRLQGDGVDAAGVGCALLGIVLLTIFVAVEARVREPMMRLSLFAARPFAIANLYTFFLYAALGGSLYFIPFDLIDVQGYSPERAGAALLPMTVLMFALSRFAGGFVVRFGPRIPLAGGALLAAAAYVVFANAGIGRPYAVSILPAAVLLGLGATAFVAPLTTLVMGAVEATHAGVASGINNAVSRTAGLLAIAVLGIVLTTVFSGSLHRQLSSARISAATRALVTGQLAFIAGGTPPAGIGDPAEKALVERAVRVAYARGFSVVMFTAAGLCGLAALLALDPGLDVANARPRIP